MSPRNKELSEEMRAQSRAAILGAARKLFAQEGYFKCRISDIAKEAGMSQGNVYWYFPSKEELLKAVLADGFGKLGKIMAESAAGAGTAHEKVDCMMDGLMDFARERGDFTAIMLSLLGHGGVPFFAQLGFDMDQIGLGYTQSVSAIVVQAQAEGTIDGQISSEIPAMFFFGLFNGLNLVYGQEWLQIPPEIIKSYVLRLFGFDL